jgi:hypothetical protein
VDGLDWMWNDLPTRVAVAGSVVYAVVMLALVWWASRHYVRSAATGWRWTTWDTAEEAERIGAVQQSTSRDRQPYEAAGWIRRHGRDTSSR